MNKISQQTSTDKYRRNSIVLFLIWPLASLILAIRNYNKPFAKNIIILFAIFYGFTFVISNADLDAVRYKQEFFKWADSTYSISQILHLYLSRDSEFVDIFVSLISYIVYHLTGNYKVYMGVLGLIYGYLYSRNIYFVINKLRGNPVFSISILIILMAMLFPIWRGINGPRFSIASNILFWGITRYIIDNKKSGLLILSLSPLIHFSSIFGVGLFWIYYIFPKKLNIVFILYLLTFFVKELDYSGARNLAESLPGVYKQRVIGYTDSNYIEEVQNSAIGLNWYVTYYTKLLNYCIISIVILLFFKGKVFLAENRKLYNLFCFSLLLLSFANIFSLLPSGGRFLTLSYLFIIPIYIWYLDIVPRLPITQFLNRITMPAILLYIIVEIRIGFDTLGILTMLGNPFIAFFVDSVNPIISLIK